MPTVGMADAKGRTREYLDLLKTLVEIESPTRDEPRNLELAQVLESLLDGMGGVVERFPAPGLGVHLLARFGGAPSDDERPILLVGHMDTVHAKGTLAQMPFEVLEDRVTGPGVYDMKGGISAAIMGLRLLHERGGTCAGPLHVLITCDEEIGSPTSRKLIESEAGKARAALVVEPSVPGGMAKTRRKGVGGYRLSVAGRAAHAGIEPEAGASAVHEMATQIGGVLELQRPGEGTTINVGVLSGGTKENVVAAHAECTIDVRFWNRSEADRVDRALREMAPADPGCALSLEGGVNRYALEKTPESGRLFEVARQAARELGFELGQGETGGGSDGNLTSAVGCPTLDGLGPDGGGAHALTEHIFREDIPQRMALMAALYEWIS